MILVHYLNLDGWACSSEARVGLGQAAELRDPLILGPASSVSERPRGRLA